MSKRETYHIELKVRKNMYDYILEQARTNPLSIKDVLHETYMACENIEQGLMGNTASDMPTLAEIKYALSKMQEKVE